MKTLANNQPRMVMPAIISPPHPSSLAPDGSNKHNDDHDTIQIDPSHAMFNPHAFSQIAFIDELLRTSPVFNRRTHNRDALGDMTAQPTRHLLSTYRYHPSRATKWIWW